MEMVAVAVGGAIGSVLRYLLGTICNQQGLPLGTWLANIVGSFCIGLLFVLGKEKGWFSPELYLLFTTGLLGGFTTFSTFSLEVVTFFLEGQVGRALLYAGISIISGLAAAYFGLWLGRTLA